MGPRQTSMAQHTEKLTPQDFIIKNEILELRSRVDGGGVAERLQGIFPESDPDHQFKDSLESIIRSRQQPTTSAAVQSKAVGADKTATVIVDVNRQTKLNNSQSDQRVLRLSARKLEELAAEFEQAKFYDKADELRKIAAQYWLQARTMD